MSKLTIRPKASVVRVMKKYTRLGRCDGKYHARLKVDHQSFAVGRDCEMSRNTAHWYRWQIASALTRMIETERKKR